jgi:CBS domain containing-hemolysin-like protein
MNEAMNTSGIILVASLFLSAFFYGMDTAIVTSDKLRLEIRKYSGTFNQMFLRLVTRYPGLTRAITLTGFNLSMVTASLSAFILFYPAHNMVSIPEWLYFIILLLAVTFSFLLLGIFIPQAVSSGFTDTFLSRISVPGFVSYFLLLPVSGFLILLLRILAKGSRLMRKVKHPEDNIFSDEEPEYFISKEEPPSGLPEKMMEKEVILLRNALDFSKVKLHEIMVPRNELAVLDINSGVETLRKKFVETGFSRILFYEGNRDNIIGYVHTSAIFQKAKSIKPFLKNVLIVPETMAANRLLSKFIREHKSIALVVDEFGGTAGLVTSEDILEEIFGEIEDEHDSIDFTGKKIGENQYVLSGRIEIDTLNEKYQLRISESDEYETLAGFILYHHESIPKPGTVINIDRFNIKILKATQTKIELVRLDVI